MSGGFLRNICIKNIRDKCNESLIERSWHLIVFEFDRKWLSCRNRNRMEVVVVSVADAPVVSNFRQFSKYVSSESSSDGRTCLRPLRRLQPSRHWFDWRTLHWWLFDKLSTWHLIMDYSVLISQSLEAGLFIGSTDVIRNNQSVGESFEWWLVKYFHICAWLHSLLPQSNRRNVVPIRWCPRDPCQGIGHTDNVSLHPLLPA